MKSQQQYDKLIEEARARTRKLNAQIEAHPNYAQSAAEFDAEYAAARTKILFVCHGNICRSPMAEFVMKDLLRRGGIENVVVESAALHTDEIGSDIHSGTRRLLAREGIPFSRRAAWLR